MNWKIFGHISLLVIVVFFSPLSNAETTWIDVRSSLEHTIDNIEGDVRISHGDIVEELSVMLPDKNAEISLYCRSGGRAETALTALKAAGYINVSNIGSINDARKKRGLIE